MKCEELLSERLTCLAVVSWHSTAGRRTTNETEYMGKSPILIPFPNTAHICIATSRCRSLLTVHVILSVGSFLRLRRGCEDFMVGFIVKFVKILVKSETFLNG
jgi:hypothetical protein